MAGRESEERIMMTLPSPADLAALRASINEMISGRSTTVVSMTTVCDSAAE